MKHTHASKVAAASGRTLSLLTFLFFLLPSCCFVIFAQTPVMFPIQSMFGSNYTRQFRVQSVAPLLTDATNIYIGSYALVAPGGGTNPVVMLTANNYLVTFPDSLTPWHITVPRSAILQNALYLTSTNWPLPTFTYQPPAGSVALGASLLASNGAAGQWMLVYANGTLATNPLPGGAFPSSNNFVGQINGPSQVYGAVPLAATAATAQSAAVATNAVQATNAAPGGNIVTNIQSVSYLSMDPNSPTNIYWLTNFPDTTYNGLYLAAYVTNGIGMLTNGNARWLCLYTGLAILQANGQYDPEEGHETYDCYSGDPPVIGWEDVDQDDYPTAAAYGIPPMIANLVQMNASTVAANNGFFTNALFQTGTNSSLWISAEPGSGDTHGVRISEVTPYGIPGSDAGGNSLYNIFTLEAGAVPGQPEESYSHEIFEEWKGNTNQNYEVMYAMATGGHPDWQARVGAYLFTPIRNDLGQFILGWTTKRGQNWDSQYNTSHAWLDIYGQDATTNCAALWLDAGTLCSNVIPGTIQFNGFFYGTFTNLDGSTNTLPLIASGQNEPVTLNGLNITNIPDAALQQSPLTNAYYTNLSTVLPASGQLAIGTNNFGGGGGASLPAPWASGVTNKPGVPLHFYLSGNTTISANSIIKIGYGNDYAPVPNNFAMGIWPYPGACLVSNFCEGLLNNGALLKNGTNMTIYVFTNFTEDVALRLVNQTPNAGGGLNFTNFLGLSDTFINVTNLMIIPTNPCAVTFSPAMQIDLMAYPGGN